MYLKWLLSDKKIKLVILIEPSQMHLSCPVNNGTNKTANKTFNRDTKKKFKLSKVS